MSLQNKFDQLEDLLLNHRESIGLHNGVPFLMVIYNPEKELECRKYIQNIKEKLESRSLQVLNIPINLMIFNNLEKEDIAGVLEVAGFPVVDSINNFLDENEDFHSTDVSYPNVMTQYHDVVLEVSAKSAGVKDMYGDKPFFLILFYDPEKIDFIKQFN